MVKHPAEYDPSLPLPLFERINGEAIIAFRENRTLGIRKALVFEAVTPWLTRSCAYASPASLPRPAQGSLPARAGSPLAGRDLHPLDDASKFQGDIAFPPIPIDQQSLVALFFLFAARDEGGRTRSSIGGREYRFPVPLLELHVRVRRELLSSRLDLHWKLC